MMRPRVLLALAALTAATALTFNVFSRTDPTCADAPIATFDAAPGKCSAFSTRGDVDGAAIVAVGIDNCVSGVSTDVYARVRTANNDTTGGSLDVVLDCAPRDSGAWLETYAVGRGVTRECSSVVNNDDGNTIAYLSITNATCDSGTPYVLAQFTERACTNPSNAVTYSFTNTMCDQLSGEPDFISRTAFIEGDSLNVSYSVGTCFAAPFSASVAVPLAALATASCFNATDDAGINGFGSFALFAAASFTAPPSTYLAEAAVLSAFFPSCTASPCGAADVGALVNTGGSAALTATKNVTTSVSRFSSYVSWGYTGPAEPALSTFFSLVFYDGTAVRALPLDARPSADTNLTYLDADKIVGLVGCQSAVLVAATFYDSTLTASAGVTLDNTIFSKAISTCPVAISVTAPAGAQVCDEVYGCYTAPLPPINGGADVIVNFTTNSPPDSQLTVCAEFFDTDNNYILYNLATIKCARASVRCSHVFS